MASVVAIARPNDAEKLGEVPKFAEPKSTMSVAPTVLSENESERYTSWPIGVVCGETVEPDT